MCLFSILAEGSVPKIDNQNDNIDISSNGGGCGVYRITRFDA
jgi:hypothetical protein